MAERNESRPAPPNRATSLPGGMLVTTMIGLRMTGDVDHDPAMRELLVTTASAEDSR